MKAFSVPAVVPVLVLAGCTATKPPLPTPVEPISPEAELGLADVDTLLRFGNTLANASPGQRRLECRQLMVRDQGNGSVGLQLHLLLAQVLVADCGDVMATLERLRARRKDIADERTWRLFAYVEQILSRVDSEMKRRNDLEQQLQDTYSKVRTTHQRIKTRDSEIKALDNEIKLLQEKLDALRAIEQNLTRPSGGN